MENSELLAKKQEELQVINKKHRELYELYLNILRNLNE